MNAKRMFAAAITAAALVVGTSSAAHAEMEERVIAQHAVTVPSPVALNAVHVQAGPRTLDPRFYDIQISIAGQPQPMISVFTGDNVHRPRINQELVRTAGALAELEIGVRYLYDSAKAVCALSVGSTCAANLPFDATNSGMEALTTQRSELVITAGVMANGSEVESRLVKIPFVGQVTAIVPDNDA